MSFVNNIPIARKFMLAFSLICTLCLGLGAYTFLVLRDLSAKSAAVGDDDLPSVVQLAAVRANINQVRRADLAMLLCQNPQCTAEEQDLRAQGVTGYQEAVRLYRPFESSPTEHDLTDQITAKFSEYIDASNRALEKLNAGKPGDALGILTANSTQETFQSALDAANQDEQFNVREGTADARHSDLVSRHAIWINFAANLVIAALCALVGFILNQAITLRIRNASRALQRMAAKDLITRLEDFGTDEIGKLSEAFNTSVGSLREVVQSVGQGAQTLSAASTEISARAVQGAGNAHLQSGKTSQIAAAAHEMTATIGEISHNAESAAEASRTSAKMAEQGGVVMRAAAETMGKIASANRTVAERMNSLAERSVEIGKVVSVIQGISEQTNLLALNAAIEAARAGEHGRGFAVVAGEVRRLAEGTKSATEEISETIRRIQEETRSTLKVMQESRGAVESGMSETSRAHQGLEEIIESSKQVEHQIHLIATAATQQTSASTEISESAEQISQLADENAHSAEATVAALKNLARMANELDSMIRQFQFEDAPTRKKSWGQPPIPAVARASARTLPI